MKTDRAKEQGRDIEPDDGMATQVTTTKSDLGTPHGKVEDWFYPSDAIFENCRRLLTRDKVFEIQEGVKEFISRHKGTTLEGISYKWYPVRKDPNGEFIIVHPDHNDTGLRTRSDHDLINLAGCSVVVGRERSKGIEYLCRNGHCDLPYFWGAFLRVSLAFHTEKPQRYPTFVDELAEMVHTRYLKESGWREPRIDFMDVFGVCVREGRGPNDAGRMPDLLHFPYSRYPGTFMPRFARDEKEILCFVITWAKKYVEDFIQSCNTVQKRGWTGFKIHTALRLI